MKAANDDRLIDQGPTQVDDEQEQVINTERVLNAVAALPDNHRLPLSLVALEGLSYAEAAEVLDIPIGTIMSRVARARGKLALIFKNVEE